MQNKHGQINKLTIAEKAYIAGMIDADGTVGIDRRSSDSNKYPYDFAARIILTNCDFEVISWFKTVIGAGCAYKSEYRYKPNWNTVHRYQITNDKAIELLKQIIPYMIVKKERSGLVINLPTRKTFNKKIGRSNENYLLQYTIWEKVSNLNRRGKK